MLWSRLQQYTFDWKVTLLVLLLFPVLLKLGFWQLDREQEKLTLQQSWEERKSQQAVAIDTLELAEDLQYREIYASGEFDNAHTLLLDNRVYQGQPGYEVLVPFYTDGASVSQETTLNVILVNRGWFALGSDRRRLPEVPDINGIVSIQGSIYVPVGEQLVLGDTTPEPGWPKRIQRIQVNEFASLLALPEKVSLFPYSVRLAAGSAGVLDRNWTVISTSPEKHRGYAVQWFSMAAMLIFLYFMVSTRAVRPETQSDQK